MTSYVPKPAGGSPRRRSSSRSLLGALAPRIVPGCLLGLLAALVLVGSGCGTSGAAHSIASQANSAHVRRVPPTPTTRAELTAFDGRAGTALTAFQRDVYAPYKQGRLKDPARHGAALRAAGAGAALTALEVTLAKQTAASSTALRKLYGPLAALELTLSQLAAGLDHGHASVATIKLAKAEIASLRRIAAAARVPVPVPAPLTTFSKN